MTCWHILSIEPTTNIKDIKRAYSKLLKKYNPEDNPKEYQELREAYDKAINLAKYPINELQDTIAADSNNEIVNEEVPLSTEIVVNKNPIDDFMTKVNEIYFDSHKRFSADEWDNLLADPILWNLDFLSEIENSLINFLFQHKYIPHRIYKKLADYFNWPARELEIYKNFPPTVSTFLFNSITKPDTLSYDYLSKISNENLENYLTLREKAFICLNKSQRQEAEKYLLDAYLLYPLDLILLKFLGEFYLVKCDTIRATRYFREALDVNDSDLYCLAKFGHLLTISKQYSTAIPYLQQAILENKSLLDTNSLFDLAESYYYSYDLNKANEIFMLLTKLKPNMNSLQLYLKSIAMKDIDKSIKTKNEILVYCNKYIDDNLTPFLLKLHSIYDDFDLRIKLSSWNSLLMEPVVTNKSLFYLMEYELIKFIVNNKYIPSFVYNLFSKSFIWKKRSNELKSLYPDLNISLLFYKIDEIMPLSYDYLNNIDKAKLNDYLEIREIAHKHVNANLSNSEDYLNQALQLYDKDYELYRLYGEYYANNSLYVEAIANFTKAASLASDEYYCSCRLALLLIRYEAYDKALIFLNKALKSSNGSMLLHSKDFLLHCAICTYYTNDLTTSKKYFEKLSNLVPNIDFIKIYLDNIDLRLNKKTRKKIDINTLNTTNTPSPSSDSENIDIDESNTAFVLTVKIIAMVFIIEIIILVIYKLTH